MSGTRSVPDVAIRPSPTGGLRVRVSAVRKVAERIVEVRLASAESGPLPAWSPGAHVEVTLQPGLARQYSLCSDPGDPEWRLAVLEERDGGGGSSYVHSTLQVGDELIVSVPRNHFRLEFSGRRLVFVGGGIGITPILPMVAAVAAAGVDWHLLHLARSPAAAAYLDELERHGDRVSAHVDTDGGPLDLAATLDRLGGRVADIYACGPAPLLQALETYATENPECHLVLERFTNTGADVRSGDHAFVVQTADGREIDVPADKTVLEALTEVGIRILSSCQEGVCGTCETVVLEGTPDHRDAVLSAAERAGGETMMVCVSRCAGPRIVLDL